MLQDQFNHLLVLTYFCESVNNRWPSLSDPLWDGQSCGSDESPCCNVPGIPWFHGNTTTTNYIELSVCGEEGTHDKDGLSNFYEIYVQ